MKLRTCVAPSGHFQYGLHKPRFKVDNLRQADHIGNLGSFSDNEPHTNHLNFPPSNVEESNADWIYEIPNPFSFRGTTYITKSWADSKAGKADEIRLPERTAISLTLLIEEWFKNDTVPNHKKKEVFGTLPDPLLLALASTSTDPKDLVSLAELCCEFVCEKGSYVPSGLKYKKDSYGNAKACIKNKPLFEVLANNLNLPDEYKEVMVLRPGVQGRSEIIGDWSSQTSQHHIFEYLRRNSYIPWGHYAANMANDSIRYQLKQLTLDDITGLRHLYYQRTYIRMARELELEFSHSKEPFSKKQLEDLRQQLMKKIHSETSPEMLTYNRTLWGWNFGFDFAPSQYRLHASHQQIHQQFALIPSTVLVQSDDPDVHDDSHFPAFSSGEMIHNFIEQYFAETGQPFFATYLKAIRNNTRLDGKHELPKSLIVYEDENVVLFVPKAQTSQWELQLMTIKPVGHILEADLGVRDSLDRSMLMAVQLLESMGARMITSIEYSKAFDSQNSDHRLLYAFLPKLPESPGAFSEAQLRWINGHYPEDFAETCRMHRDRI